MTRSQLAPCAVLAACALAAPAAGDISTSTLVVAAEFRPGDPFTFGEQIEANPNGTSRLVGQSFESFESGRLRALEFFVSTFNDSNATFEISIFNTQSGSTLGAPLGSTSIQSPVSVRGTTVTADLTSLGIDLESGVSYAYSIGVSEGSATVLGYGSDLYAGGTALQGVSIASGLDPISFADHAFAVFVPSPSSALVPLGAALAFCRRNRSALSSPR